MASTSLSRASHKESRQGLMSVRSGQTSRGHHDSLEPRLARYRLPQLPPPTTWPGAERVGDPRDQRVCRVPHSPRSDGGTEGVEAPYPTVPRRYGYAGASPGEPMTECPKCRKMIAEAAW